MIEQCVLKVSKRCSFSRGASSMDGSRVSCEPPRLPVQICPEAASYLPMTAEAPLPTVVFCRSVNVARPCFPCPTNMLCTAPSCWTWRVVMPNHDNGWPAHELRTYDVRV